MAIQVGMTVQADTDRSTSNWEQASVLERIKSLVDSHRDAAIDFNGIRHSQRASAVHSECESMLMTYLKASVCDLHELLKSRDLELDRKDAELISVSSAMSELMIAHKSVLNEVSDLKLKLDELRVNAGTRIFELTCVGESLLRENTDLVNKSEAMTEHIAQLQHQIKYLQDCLTFEKECDEREFAYHIPTGREIMDSLGSLFSAFNPRRGNIPALTRGSDAEGDAENKDEAQSSDETGASQTPMFLIADSVDEEGTRDEFQSLQSTSCLQDVEDDEELVEILEIQGIQEIQEIQENTQSSLCIDHFETKAAHLCSTPHSPEKGDCNVHDELTRDSSHSGQVSESSELEAGSAQSELATLRAEVKDQVLLASYLQKKLKSTIETCRLTEQNYYRGEIQLQDEWSRMASRNIELAEENSDLKKDCDELLIKSRQFEFQADYWKQVAQSFQDELVCEKAAHELNMNCRQASNCQVGIDSYCERDHLLGSSPEILEHRETLPQKQDQSHPAHVAQLWSFFDCDKEITEQKTAWSPAETLQPELHQSEAEVDGVAAPGLPVPLPSSLALQSPLIFSLTPTVQLSVVPSSEFGGGDEQVQPYEQIQPEFTSCDTPLAHDTDLSGHDELGRCESPNASARCENLTETARQEILEFAQQDAQSPTHLGHKDSRLSTVSSSSTMETASAGGVAEKALELQLNHLKEGSIPVGGSCFGALGRKKQNRSPKRRWMSSFFSCFGRTQE